jgi:hypothetical protein
MKKPAEGILQLPYSADLTKFIEYVNTFSDDEWNSWSFRQTLGNHESTNTIKIQWIPLTVKKYDETLIERNEPIYSIATEFLKDTLNFLKEYYDGTIFKIILPRLKAGSSIGLHRDSSFSLMVPHRVHIPIVTNEDVMFGCGASRLNMKVGNLYEINNSLKHWVVNRSHQDRIHLIVDVIENKMIRGEK